MRMTLDPRKRKFIIIFVILQCSIVTEKTLGVKAFLGAAFQWNSGPLDVKAQKWDVFGLKNQRSKGLRMVTALDVKARYWALSS